MNKIIPLVRKLNDFGGLNMSYGSLDRHKAIKIINRFCKNNNLYCNWDWKIDKFIIDDRFYLYQNSLKWFEIKEI